ncbi:hypothetical protein D5018_13415 [Parashewanella curva]|uniref:Uncharacterized protein n=1 Tax=Parashewanella curva TaxID=2338552 RepID=A0A3L8PWP2_9GAMM|nr:hypothetical protein [Parashewanella curva]RLV59209.1 hypothetical protein D5018_13415 [Parashewanella curva]
MRILIATTFIALCLLGCKSTEHNKATKQKAITTSLITTPANQDELIYFKKMSGIFISVYSGISDFPLGYDTKSIKYLDELLNSKHVRESKRRDYYINMAGSFLGEAFIHTYGGEWVKYNGEYAIKHDRNHLSFPFGKVYRVLENGGKGDIEAMYALGALTPEQISDLLKENSAKNE